MGNPLVRHKLNRGNKWDTIYYMWKKFSCNAVLWSFEKQCKGESISFFNDIDYRVKNAYTKIALSVEH